MQFNPLSDTHVFQTQCLWFVTQVFCLQAQTKITQVMSLQSLFLLRPHGFPSIPASTVTTAFSFSSSLVSPFPNPTLFSTQTISFPPHPLLPNPCPVISLLLCPQLILWLLTWRTALPLPTPASYYSSHTHTQTQLAVLAHLPAHFCLP